MTKHLVVGILLLALSATANASRILLRLSVKDVVSDATVPGVGVDVSVKPPPRTRPTVVTPVGGEYLFDKSPQQPADIASIRVTPTKAYGPRVLALRRLPTEGDDLIRELAIPVVASNLELPYRVLREYRAQLDAKQWETALAVYEAAYERLGSGRHRDQYSIHVRYYYARSLIGACQELAYDTCGKAIAVCHSLSADYDKRVFGAENLTREDVAQCEKDARTGAATLMAGDLRRLYLRGGDDYLAAAQAWEDISKARGATAETWSSIGWPQWAAQRDAANAYTRYGAALSASGRYSEAGERFRSADRLLAKAVAAAGERDDLITSMNYLHDRQVANDKAIHENEKAPQVDYPDNSSGDLDTASVIRDIPEQRTLEHHGQTLQVTLINCDRSAEVIECALLLTNRGHAINFEVQQTSMRDAQRHSYVAAPSVSGPEDQQVVAADSSEVRRIRFTTSASTDYSNVLLRVSGWIWDRPTDRRWFSLDFPVNISAP